MRFRSPPPLPSIFLMGGYLTKTRGGKKRRLGRGPGFVSYFSGTSDNRTSRLQLAITSGLPTIQELWHLGLEAKCRKRPTSTDRAFTTHRLRLHEQET